MPPARLGEILRFGSVAVLGLLADLAVAWELATQLSLPLPAAAVLGFCCGAAVNYLLHETWTFRDGPGRISTRRGLIYLCSLGLVLAVRIGSLALFELTLGYSAGREMPFLLAATGLSFAANYLLSRHVVFQSQRGTDGANPRPETE